VRLAWNVIFSLEHFGNGNHKLSSYRSGLGQGCSGLRQAARREPFGSDLKAELLRAELLRVERLTAERHLGRTSNPVKKVPRHVGAKFTGVSIIHEQ